MPALTIPNTFVAYTKIKSSEVNANFTAITTLLNTTKLDDDNIQNAGITRATKLKLGTASHVLINDGSGAMSSEAQLAVSRGGTGAATATAGFDALAPTTTRGDLIYRNASTNARLAIGTANYVLKTDGTDPAWGLIVNANIDGSAAIARSKIATGTADHVIINDGSGNLSSEAQLTVARGGTGASSLTANGILYGNGTSAVAATSAGSQYQVYQAGGSGVPTVGALALSQTAATTGQLLTSRGGTGQDFSASSGAISVSGGTMSAGTLSVGNGGTGATSLTSNGILYGNGSSAVAATSAGSQYQVYQAGGSGVPTVGALALAQTAATTGQLLVSRGGTGQDFSASTGAISVSSGTVSAGTLGATMGGTAQSTYTTGDMLYASGTNTLSKLTVGSSGQVIKSVGGVPTWATFSGGINYIASNPDAEADTTGWATYADAAGNVPVDGTGGSPNSTFTRTTSSPLRGSASFLFTKSGSANRQGEGASFAFTLDAADAAKPLQISFDYIVASGTFTASNGTTAPLNDGTTSTNAGNSDLEVFIYDVTNSTLIVPASQVLTSSSSSIPGSYKGIFQTSATGTSYRLIIHTATTTTNNFTLKFDNFYVGPQVQLLGSPVTDWVSYTPTGTWTTNTTYSGYWRRVGDSMHVQVDVSCSGAPPEGTAMKVNLPSGYTINTSKIPSTTEYIVGYGRAIDSGVKGYDLQVLYSSTTQVGINVSSPGTGFNDYPQMTNSTPFTVGASDRFSINFTVPISGWSSSVAMSNDSDTRVVAARCSNSTTSITASDTTIVFTTEDYDTHSALDPSTATFTAPVSGYYRVSAHILHSNTSWGGANNNANLILYKNGASYADLAVCVAQTTGTFRHSTSGATTLYLIAGDTTALKANQAVTGSIPSGASNSWFCVERVSGPSAIAATEGVSARYTTTTAGSYASTNPINFETKEYDTHGAVTTGTGTVGSSGWKFTAPVSGKYRVTTHIRFQAFALSVGDSISFLLSKNGSDYAYIQNVIAQTTTSIVWPLSGSVDVVLNAGDYIQPYVSSGGTRSLSTNAAINHIEISKIS